MFDINTVIATGGVSAFASALLFAFTWFLGSGALFSALVTRCLDYSRRRRNGLIHHDFRSEGGHTIILGWDDNVPTLIKEISEYDKFMGRLGLERRVAVVTVQDVPEIRKLIRACGKDEKLYVSVCRGHYDDVDDIIANYSLDAAREIYLVGESEESGHDARMLNLVARLNKRLGGKCTDPNSQIVAHVKIASFLLFSRLKRSRKASNSYPLLLDYFNFYDNWSKRLWAMLPTKDRAAYPALRFMHHDCKKTVRVVIVGFSQMGQALAVEAARVAHYGDEVKTEIRVIGENTEAPSRAFLREYPEIKAPTTHLELSIEDVKEGYYSSAFLDKIKALVSDDAQTSVVISITDATAALEIMKDLLDLLDGSKADFRIYVRQDIETFGVNRPNEDFLDLPECDSVYYFGFKNGAAYNAWRRERLARAIFKNREEWDVGNNEYTSIYRKEKFKQRVDSFKELFHSVGLEFVDVADGCGMGLGVPIGSAVGEILAKATHRRWIAEVKMNCNSNPIRPELANYNNRFNDEAQEKDRAQIAEAPTFLEQIAYKITMTPEEFYKKYAVADPAGMAVKFRNPKTPALLALAREEGERLVKDCGIAGAEYFVGGSLGYDAVLKGGFDIDLRLLVPGDWDDGATRRNIDAAQKVLVDRATANGEEIKCKFIDEGGTNYIQHTKQIVHKSWAEGEIELTWNIQAENSYKSIAGMSAKLPQIVKDRYVAAKGLAKDESKEAYDALKVHWRDFIDWLVDHGAKDMNGKALDDLLLKARDLFPLFLT
ncbi:MAG: hypothetical protein IJG18_01850 [Kiritimatiellae bacterium]|nr:hypothetical protein [Kiritimatiellia bacterium]